MYDVTRIGEAHEFTQNRVLKKVRDYWSPIIVDNTHMKLWEMFPYVRMAAQHKYTIFIMEPVTPWATSARTLSQKNSHSVPKDKIRKMLDNYERTDVRNLLQILNLEHNLMLVPELRHYPVFTKEFMDTNVHTFPDTVIQPQETAWVDDPMNDDDSSPNELPSPETIPKPRRGMFDSKEPSKWKPPPDTKNENMDWQTFEKDNFWSKYNQEQSKDAEKREMLPSSSSFETPQTITPKPKREVQFSLLDHIQQLARENRQQYKEELEEKAKLAEAAIPKLLLEQEQLTKSELVKHRKNCDNENKAFREIRQMFPSISLSFLWDLFVKCGGDGDWTTDVLLNDSNMSSYETTEFEDFNCNCGKKIIQSGKHEVIVIIT